MKTVTVSDGRQRVLRLTSVDQLRGHYIPVEDCFGVWERSAFFGLYELKSIGEVWWDALIHFQRDALSWDGKGGTPTMIYENMVTPPGWQHFDLLEAAIGAGYEDDRRLWWIGLDSWANAVSYENQNPIEACYLSGDIALPHYMFPEKPKRDNPYIVGNCFKVYRNNPRKRYYRGDRPRAL